MNAVFSQNMVISIEEKNNSILQNHLIKQLGKFYFKDVLLIILNKMRNYMKIDHIANFYKHNEDTVCMYMRVMIPYELVEV